MFTRTGVLQVDCADGDAGEMAKQYVPADVEERLYKWWEDQGYFKPAEDNGKQCFVMSMPPPNVTGRLHMGHAMFVALEDIMARFHRMRGHPTLWLPGTDHAGIATQMLVEKDLKSKGMDRVRNGQAHPQSYTPTPDAVTSNSVSAPALHRLRWAATPSSSVCGRGRRNMVVPSPPRYELPLGPSDPFPSRPLPLANRRAPSHAVQPLFVPSLRSLIYPSTLFVVRSVALVPRATGHARSSRSNLNFVNPSPRPSSLS